MGRNKFVFQAPAPDPSKIPAEKDLLEVTVILLTCSYLDQEFIRVGYYVNNDYGPNTALYEQHKKMSDEGIPFRVAMDELHRAILADKPRVTRFQIHWSEEELRAAKQHQSTMEGIPCTDSAPAAYQGEYQEMEDEDMEEEDLDDDDSEEEEGDDEDDEDEDIEDDDKENMVEQNHSASFQQPETNNPQGQQNSTENKLPGFTVPQPNGTMPMQ